MKLCNPELDNWKDRLCRLERKSALCFVLSRTRSESSIPVNCDLTLKCDLTLTCNKSGSTVRSVSDGNKHANETKDLPMNITSRATTALEASRHA